MADLAVLLNQLSTPIKVGWMLWLAWSAVQVLWYRRLPVAEPVLQPVPRPRLERRRPEPPTANSDSILGLRHSGAGDVAAVSDPPQPSNSAGTTTQQSDSAAAAGDAGSPSV